MKAGFSDQEYQQYLSRLPLIDVESALASIDTDKFPSRYKLLVERRLEIKKSEAAILERYSQVRRIPLKINLTHRWARSTKLVLGEYEILGNYLEIEVRKNSKKFLQIKPPVVTDDKENEIGRIAINFGIDRDRFALRLQIGPVRYHIIESNEKRGLHGFLSGSNNYSARTEQDLIGTFEVNSLDGKTEVSGFYYEGSENFLWFIGIFVIHEATQSDNS